MVNHFIISPSDLAIEITEEEDQNYEEQIENLKYARGNFIEILIEIENKIDAIIETILVKDDEIFKKIFRKKILNSKILTLRRKSDLLFELMRIDDFNVDLKKLSKYLDFLVSERNKWAHGLIFFERKKVNEQFILQANLLYYNAKDELTSREINTHYVKDINNKLEIIYAQINKMIDNLGIGFSQIISDKG